MSSLLLPVYKLSREDTQPENICNKVFEKVKRGAGKAEVFMQKQPSERFFKKGVMRILQNSQKTIYAGISFLIKLNSVELQLP